MIPIVGCAVLRFESVISPIVCVRDHIAFCMTGNILEILPDAAGIEGYGCKIGEQHIVSKEEVVFRRARHRDNVAVEIMRIGCKKSPRPERRPIDPRGRRSSGPGDTLRTNRRNGRMFPHPATRYCGACPQDASISRFRQLAMTRMMAIESPGATVFSYVNALQPGTTRSPTGPRGNAPPRHDDVPVSLTESSDASMTQPVGSSPIFWTTNPAIAVCACAKVDITALFGAS